jgi:hypothetical protein
MANTITPNTIAQQSVKLIIHNKGQEILSSNFWQTEYDRRGLFYLSINAGPKMTPAMAAGVERNF